MRHYSSIIDPFATFNQSRGYYNIVIQPPKPTLFEKVRAAVAYTGLAIGVGVAAFYVTPSHAAGSMAQDVRVVTASPSIVYFGNTREGRKAQADIMRDDNKALHNIELENLRSVNRRNEEADKAYYDRLKDQRKGKCTYC